MNNENLSSLTSRMQSVDGRKVFKASEVAGAPALIISGEDIIIAGPEGKTGAFFDKSGVTLQGDLFFTSYGTHIKKAHFSENPNSAKIFTYTETIEAEALIKEKLTGIANKVGIDTDEMLDKAGIGSLSGMTKGGMIPLMTDISYGPIPHIHTMLFKHVHRVEPAYLYSTPKYIKLFSNFTKLFTNFLSA